MPETYDVTITDIVDETPEVRTFRLGPVPETFAYDPGQFVTIGCTLPDGRKIRRAYSIANPPTRPGYVDITMRRIEDGRLSRFLFDTGRVGTPLKMMGPYGEFVFREEMGASIVLIGAGSGVVPLMCILRYAQDRHLPLHLTLIYSSRTWEHVIYRDELSALSEQVPGLRIIHTLSRVNGREWHGFCGRITEGMLRACLPSCAAPDTLYYVCGPPRMCASTSDFLRNLGVGDKKILVETYE